MYRRLIGTVICLMLLQGCVATAIDTASSAAIEVAKIPFKVVGAVVSGVSGGDKKDEDKES